MGVAALVAGWVGAGGVGVGVEAGLVASRVGAASSGAVLQPAAARAPRMSARRTMPREVVTAASVVLSTVTTSLSTPPTTPVDLGSGVPRWVAPALVANVVAQVGIVVTGGLVRLTGSGLGCPTWPQCAPGSYTPTIEQAEGYHKYIEFGNRLLTFVLTVIAIACVYAAVKHLRRRHLTVAAWLVLGGVALQAGIGGVTVLTSLHPITVSVHFLASALLIAAASYLWFARSEPSALRHLLVPDLVGRLAWVTTAVGLVVLTLGTLVTGSGPHSGDAQAPARYGFDPRQMSWLHADAVMLFVGLVIGMWVAVHLAARGGGALGRDVRGAWRDVFLVTMAQGLVGYVQYFSGLPEILVLAHMFGASILVVVLTRALVTMRTSQPTALVPAA